MSHTVVPALAGWLETSPDKAQEHTHTHGSYANVYSPGANKLLSTHAVRAQCGCRREAFSPCNKCAPPTDGGSSSARDAVAESV